VVDGSAVTPTNTNGGSNFDTTRGIFDPNVVGEYLSCTGLKGGPLVTSNNVTARSDLRLYESDNNATMRALFARGAEFLDICADLMGRAMNTVPSGVQLSEVISAMPVKPINVTYDYGSDGLLKLSGKIRILTEAHTSPPSSFTFSIANYDTELIAEPEAGSSVFGRSGSMYGTTTYFPFSIAALSIRNATSFSITAPSISKQRFPITSQIFVVPSLTTLSGRTLNATVAISASISCDNLAVRIAAPFTQPGTLAPKISDMELELGVLTGQADGYGLCHGVRGLDDVPTGAVTIKVSTGGHVVDTLLVNGGAAGW
jgi:hypothetical protein